MRKGKFPNHQKFLAVLLLYGTSVKEKKKKNHHQNKQKENTRKKLRDPSQKIQLTALGIKQYQRLNYQQKFDAMNHRNEGS